MQAGGTPSGHDFLRKILLPTKDVNILYCQSGHYLENKTETLRKALDIATVLAVMYLVNYNVSFTVTTRFGSY